MGAAAGPLAAQREQRVRQRVDGGLGRADVHQAQPARGNHDRVQLPVDVGELQQVGVAELVEQVGRAEGLGLGRRHRWGVQDALAHRGLEPSALPLQRGRRGPAVQGAVHAGGDVAQGGQVRHQVAVGGRANRADPQHGAAQALAPLQEQTGVTAAHRVPQSHVRQLRAVGRGQRAQLSSAEGLQVQVEQGQPTVARGQHAPPAPFGFAPRGLGQPADAASTQLAAVPGVRGEPQVAGRLLPAASGQGDPPGEQVSIDGAPGVQLVQPGGDPPGRLQQGGRGILAPCEPATQQDELGPRRPPRPLLAPEQPQRLGAALLRQAEVAGRGGGDGGRVEQLGAPGRRAVIPLDPGHRRIGLEQGIVHQAGGEQHRAFVDKQVGREGIQLVVQSLSMVKVSERRGKITTGMRGHSALLSRRRVLHLLAALRVQFLGQCVISVGPADIAHGQVHRGPPDDGTGFPHQVTRAGQQADRGLGVPERLGIATQDMEGADPADQDPAARDATIAGSYQVVQDGQATPRLAGQDHGHAKARRDIRCPLEIARLTCETACGLEFLDSLPDVAEILEHYAGRLVRHRGLQCRRVSGQQFASRGKGLRWPR